MRPTDAGTALIAAAATALTLTGLAGADEIVVRNDSIEENDPVGIQVGFIANESAAAWLTSPCDGRIIALQVFWASFQGGAKPSVQDSITVYAAGDFPEPGAELAFLEGPVMTDGVVNEFRYLDEFNTVPIDIPVSQGQTFVVSFKFAETPDPLGPSVVTDIDGCQPGKNALFAIPGGWINPCLIGLSGDFFIRAVVDCETLPGACCLGDGTCRDDISEDDCATAGGVFLGGGTVCSDDACPQACCFDGGGCVDLSVSNCENAGGVPQGLGTECATTECNPIGACCLRDGSCQDELSPEDCDTLDGVYQGSGSDCGTTDCLALDGACCFPNEFCLVLTGNECRKAGAAWAGPGTDCTDGDENGQADACEDCPADLDGSGAVDFGDILDILSTWGPCPGCPEDLDESDAVDFADILIVLASWGPCD